MTRSSDARAFSLQCSILALTCLGWRQADVASSLGCRQTYVSRICIRYGIRRHTRHNAPKHQTHTRNILTYAAGNGIMTG